MVQDKAKLILMNCVRWYTEASIYGDFMVKKVELRGAEAVAKGIWRHEYLHGDSRTEHAYIW